MECNKDEAAKAKVLAEKKFEEKDIMGARKFAMKAHNLFPALDGLQPLLATLNIYLSAERKINGEVDWYGVFGVEPSSDDETVRKQYRKLALTLHPDKNKSVGAEGAFKILSEAWSLLSDKARRSAYDQKRISRGIFQKVVPANPSKPVRTDSVRRSANNGNLNVKSQGASNPHLSSVPPPRCNTFWTVCTSCKMQFEYVLFYLNKKLECYSCKVPFLATQISPPQTNFHPPWASRVPQDTSGYPSAPMTSSTERKTFASTPASRPAEYTGGVGNVTASASSGVQTMNGTQLPCENLKGMHRGSQVSATLEAVIKSKSNVFKRASAVEANGSCSAVNGEKPKKRRRANKLKMHDNGMVKTDQLFRGVETSEVGISDGVQGGLTEMERTVFGIKWPASTRELSLLETRNMLIAKAKKVICKKLNEWKNMEAKRIASSKEDGPREEERTKEKVSNFKTLRIANLNRLGTVGSKHPDAKSKITSSASSAVDSETQASENAPLSMNVPDPDFHNFDKDRTENSFGDNQVWAAYDNDDGMPRYYAMIHSVISRKPFKMRISWLNSKSNAEFGSINWVGCGFYKTSGDFRVGKYEINKSVNSFSHRVKWTKGARGAIRIYPSKGDVWALYKNWSPEWTEHTPDEVVHQYDMVEVLDDYNEDRGVSVIPLVKAAGFKTVFCPLMDQEQARVIPREEMFRFSHQVPSRLLTGQESCTAPKGCWELDPAAMPMELLQVITNAREQGRKENSDEVARGDVMKTDLKEPIQRDIATNEEKMENGIRIHLGTTV